LRERAPLDRRAPRALDQRKLRSDAALIRYATADRIVELD